MKMKYIILFLYIFNVIVFSQEVIKYDQSNSIIDESNLTSIAVDSSNTILMGSANKHFYEYTNEWKEDTNVWDYTNGYSISDIEVAPNGTIWIGISDDLNGDIYYLSNKTWQKVDGSYGTFWLGNIFIENDSTLYYTLINSWPHSLHADKIAILKNDSISVSQDYLIAVNRIVPFNKDTVLTSLYGGIAKYNRDSLIYINPLDWIPNYVSKIDSQIFVYGDRLSKYTNNKYISYPKVDSILLKDSLKITSFTIEKPNILWIGTDNGEIIRFNKNVDVYKLSNVPIFKIVVDKFMNKWFINHEGCFIFNENKIVGVSSNSQYNLPSKYFISQNYPNPFNPTTKISYAIPANVKSEKVKVKLIVYDILGRQIVTLVNKVQNVGSYEVEFDGSSLASGIYFYNLQVGDYVQSKKMVLLK